MSSREDAYRLFIDIQAVQSGFYGDRGIPRYATELTRGLLRRRPDSIIALNPFLTWPKSLHPELAASPQLALNTRQRLRSALDGGPVAYVVMSPFELYRPVQTVIPEHVVESGVPVVSMLYDLIPEVLGLYDAISHSLSLAYQRRREWVRGCDLFLALSEHTRRDAIERLALRSDQVVVVGAGASGFFRPARPGEPPRLDAARKLPEVSKPFVLSVTGYVDHKNAETLIDAWAKLPSSFRASRQLVLTCSLPETGATRWIERARRLGIDDGEIVYTGYVPEEALRALYRGADLFVFPSLYEGFGLPVLEAACCGTPAITSDASSLPEVLAHPPATFPPYDSDALAALMVRAVEDDAFRRELLSAGERAVERHTWDRVVDRSLDALALLPTPRRARRTPQMRIALVGPFPPSPSGVATYNHRLAEALTAHALVDCFAEPTRQPRPRDARSYRRFPASALGTTFDAASYDAVIYTIGNSLHHVETYRLAGRSPGLVWFHDANVAGLQLAQAWEHGDEERARAYMRELLDRLGYLPPMTPAREGLLLDLEAYHDAGILLARELLAGARGCIVNSELARSMLSLDAGANMQMPPTWVVPLAAPAVPLSSSLVQEAPLVVALGVVHPFKQPELLLDAFARLRSRGPARLAFVGPVHDADVEADLRQQVRELGIRDFVELPGRVSDEAYARWIQESACVVQLGRHRFGHSSAAVHDALAHGRPVVTNLPTAHELPDGAALLVPEDVGPSQLADTIERVLTDSALAQSVASAGRRYAESWTFGEVARRVVEVVRELSAHRDGRALSTVRASA